MVLTLNPVAALTLPKTKGCLTLKKPKLSDLHIPTCATAASTQTRAATKTKLDESGPSHALNLAYRVLSDFDEHRQCRLHPTCSGFLQQATQRAGLLGWLWASARTQMSHDDQGGRLPSRLASDHLWIYDDDIKNWN